MLKYDLEVRDKDFRISCKVLVSAKDERVLKKDYPVPLSCISLVYSQSFDYSDKGKCGTEKVPYILDKTLQTKF